jgi:hypothetical protein
VGVKIRREPEQHDSDKAALFPAIYPNGVRVHDNPSRPGKGLSSRVRIYISEGALCSDLGSLCGFCPPLALRPTLFHHVREPLSSFRRESSPAWLVGLPCGTSAARSPAADLFQCVDSFVNASALAF